MTSGEVKRRAVELGFDLCGVAPVAEFPELSFYQEWLAKGYAGDMEYLHRTASRRADVREIMPDARSVIVLGTRYSVDRPYSTEVASPSAALIARYAWGDDYHDVIGGRMSALIEWLRAEAGESVGARGYVDTGPVQERVYAQYAGLGWIGRNTCLINPDLGSFLFLSEIICTLALEPDRPGLDQCGSCRLCLDACPTGALVASHVLDSTRCLSYLTIEIRGPIPVLNRDALGTHAYGCDICQEVCPWNLQAADESTTDPAWLPRAVFDGRSLADLWRTSDADLRRGLKKSAMMRAGLKRLRRNVAVCVGATGDEAGLDALAECHEPSCADPLVAEHVTWALERHGRRRASGGPAGGAGDSRAGSEGHG